MPDQPKISNRPTIVCLCGSSRFYSEFQQANYTETMAGNIVLSIGFAVEGSEHGESVGCTPEQKLALDELHKRKIDIADEVLVLNPDGYIGESTRSEIEYAHENRKRVRYLIDMWASGRPWCCEPGCDRDATKVVTDPERPYDEAETHACDEHLINIGGGADNGTLVSDIGTVIGAP